jgi:hypothetical protein
MKGERSLKKPIFVLILGAVLAGLCVPAGFAVAEITQTSDPGNEWSHEDPDPSTDGIQALKNLEAAQSSGAPRAEQEAVDALRAEVVSRMAPEDRAAAEAAPKEVEVPQGTVGYIADEVPGVIVEGCETRLLKGQEDPFCELLILNAEGKARSGPYTSAQIDAALKEAK